MVQHDELFTRRTYFLAFIVRNDYAELETLNCALLYILQGGLLGKWYSDTKYSAMLATIMEQRHRGAGATQMAAQQATVEVEAVVGMMYNMQEDGDGGVERAAFGLEQFGVAFYVLAIGIALSGICFIVETLVLLRI